MAEQILSMSSGTCSKPRTERSSDCSESSSPVELGSVAAIVDKWGGWRVVVTSDDRTFRSQLDASCDERVYAVPDYLEPMYADADGAGRADGLHRPLWNRSAYIVGRAEKEMEDRQPSACGVCRQCCIVLYIGDDGDGFTKPSQTPCRHLCGTGCGIQKRKPKVCRTFECLWLRSQRGNRPMPAELRPDRCGAILTDYDEGAIRVHVNPGKPRSWPLKQWIETRAGEGDSFEEVTHYYGER